MQGEAHFADDGWRGVSTCLLMRRGEGVPREWRRGTHECVRHVKMERLFHDEP